MYYATTDRSGGMSFSYAEQWLKQPGARALSLSLPLTNQRYEGAQVYNFFDNLLPDSENIRARMQARFRINTGHPFDLLSVIGRDCIGAVQLYPPDISIPDVRSVHAEPVSDDAIAAMLAGYQQAPLGMTEDSDFRISLAGAQEKTALLWHEEQWKRPVGSTPTSHILKLPIGFLEPRNIDLRESNENEWLCLQILKGFGIPVADAQLLRFNEQSVLCVQRFDRRWSSDGSWLMRLPQEDFCQALGVAPALKYENEGGPGIEACLKLLAGSQNAEADRRTFFKSQILFWLLAAIDGHAKNFSLFIEPDSGYRMTPLYDVISAYPMMATGSLPAARAKMAMSQKGRQRHYHWQRMEPRHFISTAIETGFSTATTRQLMQETALLAERVIDAVRNQLPANFPPKIAEPIFTGVQDHAEKLTEYLTDHSG
ncbi:type II toxin-antitoxin system HipA family toxin [Marinospirillum sp.]|uniref:type II toxin-antitoxin system HipA family toxin n=1 Tax=Marinospirillum sp. TaxID=2183934 RepID=UPI0025C396A3|nr:type II toxin-antitoxin system HipA family toxin [Marinospirillum sp.]